MNHIRDDHGHSKLAETCMASVVYTNAIFLISVILINVDDKHCIRYICSAYDAFVSLLRE